MIPHNHNRKVRRPRMVAVRNRQPHCVFYTIEWLSNGKWRKILDSQRKRHMDDVFETLCDGHKPLIDCNRCRHAEWPPRGVMVSKPGALGCKLHVKGECTKFEEV